MHLPQQITLQIYRSTTNDQKTRHVAHVCVCMQTVVACLRANHPLGLA
jgi:hypothetical protein